MKYEFKKIAEKEWMLDINEGAVMIPDVKRLMKKLAHSKPSKEVQIVRAYVNGVYFMDYFRNLKEYSIAQEIK